MLNEEYKQAKEAFGIITSLGDDSGPSSPKPKKSKKRPRKATAVVGGRSASAEAKAIAEELIRNDGCLLPGVPQRGIRRTVPQVGGGLGEEATVAASSRKAGDLGLWCRANHRVGQLSPRSKPDPAPETLCPSTKRSA